MRLFVRDTLCKSDSTKSSDGSARGDRKTPSDATKDIKDENPKPKKSNAGEQRGGNYIARVQEGYNRDGTPKYRYFKTHEEYEAHIKQAGKVKKSLYIKAM